MRPVRLELRGFTAFRDPQSVDFAGLDLFAIAGPTGSGKSSILDAMTYALYGYVERVGKQCSRLISQGQPRMAVAFEFEVRDRRFRVTRSTPAKGATRILLERWEDGQWRQAGEGADRVRDADAMICDAVGLDYDAFTRSVLLPQGRFAEFLVGEAKDRRDILTELLGLELFQRLATVAGELKRSAAAEADAGQHLLETEYSGVSPEAVALEEDAAARAAAREETLAESEAAVRLVADRWAETARLMRDVLACAQDVGDAASLATASARSLDAMATEQAEVEALAKERARAAASAVRVAERAEAARARAEAEWGRVKDLGALCAKAEELAGARGALAVAEAELRALRRDRPVLEQAVGVAEELLATRGAAVETAKSVLERATAALHDAQHADLVAAVRAGVRPGERCPVCGARVVSLPKGARARSLERANTAVLQGERRVAAADESLNEVRQEKEAAERELRDADRDLERLDAELSRRRKDVAAVERALAKAMGGELPSDPAAALEDRIRRLETLETAALSAAEEAADAKDSVATAERQRDVLGAAVAEERGRLDAIPGAVLIQRARELGVGPVPDAPRVPTAKDAARLAATAEVLATGLAALADALELRAADLAEGEGRLLSEAARMVEELPQPATSLAQLVEFVADLRRRAAAAAARAAQEAESQRRKLENARALAERISERRVHAQRFDALAKELRADHIIAFLQLEALQILAAAGSQHLSGLSDGRYRLAYEGDEFFVVDTWNGEEQRSARTLSGGETFLASLALALALSEQVRSLSLAERARLDSLFLDEGFGTLDPETLETVVEAIEQLGGDGRMVGVVTHVQELAIRLPTRIEVEKSPRGSRLQIVR